MRKIPITLQVGKTYVDNAGNPSLVTSTINGEDFQVRDIYGAVYYHNKHGQFCGEEQNSEYARHLVRPLYSVGETYYTRGASPVEVEGINDDVSETYRINGDYVIDGRYYNDNNGNASDLMDYVGGFVTGEPAMEPVPTPVEDVIAVAALRVESTAPIPAPCADACTFCPGENSDGCCKNRNDAPVAEKCGYVMSNADAEAVWNAYCVTLAVRLPTHDELMRARAEIMAKVGVLIECV